MPTAVDVLVAGRSTRAEPTLLTWIAPWPRVTVMALAQSVHALTARGASAGVVIRALGGLQVAGRAHPAVHADARPVHSGTPGPTATTAVTSLSRLTTHY